MQAFRRVLSIAVLVGLVVGILLFATRPTNQDAVAVHYLFGTSEWPLWEVVGAAFVAGGVAGWLLAALPWTRAKLAARRHRKHAERLETELHQLRNLPLSRDETPPSSPAALGEGPSGDTGSA